MPSKMQKRCFVLVPKKNLLLKKLEEVVMKNGFKILVCGNLLRIDAPGIFYESGKTNTSSVFSVLEEFFHALQGSNQVCGPPGVGFERCEQPIERHGIRGALDQAARPPAVRF